jgi:RNA polymerase sigma factor (sigma-70 family)
MARAFACSARRISVKTRSSESHYLYEVSGTRMTDAVEIERVYQEQGGRLWRSLLAYTGDRDLASDAAAEAFARALKAADQILDPAAWVWRVAFRIATADLRDPHRRSQILSSDSYEIDDRPLEVLVALHQLSGRQRAVFVLYYLADRPTEQIAELLGMAPSTVAVHLHRARHRLRTILGDDDG